MTFIYLILIIAVAPLYVVNKLDMKFFQNRNKTVIGLVAATSDRDQVENILFAINVFIPVVAFLIIIVCTIILVHSLKRKSDWRLKSTNAAQADALSSRNTRVVKMVVMISVTFIVCFVPCCLLFLAMCLDPELTVVGKHRNFLIVFGGTGLVLESLNSSVNIFIYYSMSNNYRVVLRRMLCLHN